MKYYCNPVNLTYKYQFFSKEDGVYASREAADPSLVFFKGKYYLFPSMTKGFFVSSDLCVWKFHKLPDSLPLYGYAPDVRVIGDRLYFCASSRKNNCSFYRTKDPENGEFEEFPGTFPFWDPNLFLDDDGRLYFYHGCSNRDPIYGMELDPTTMRPVGEQAELIHAYTEDFGYERNGENHQLHKSEEQIVIEMKNIAEQYMGTDDLSRIPEEHLNALRAAVCNPSPYLEGTWMTKHEGKYYLQYAATGTEFNIYSDCVYTSESPLGPFEAAKNNPFSYKPGGFITAAGHGSTLEDADGNWWHISSMRISKNENFERRIGLWKAGFDAEGELYCDQRFGDWVQKTDSAPFEKPEWMLLSYGKEAKVSSGQGAAFITDEDIRTWWKAAEADSGQWAEIDLGGAADVFAVQVNFADDALKVSVPENITFSGEAGKRYIDEEKHVTRWILEGSVDGQNYFVIEEKSDAETDLPHDLVVIENGVKCRYIKLTVIELPFGQAACVSGIRVFGNAQGDMPEPAEISTDWLSPLDLRVKWPAGNATGANILGGMRRISSTIVAWCSANRNM
jgi:hypothetical protein